MTTKELLAKIDDMPKLNDKTLNKRASDKAFAKLFHLTEELETLKNAIIDRLYYRPSYLKGLKVVANRLVLSPFIDLRLKTLLNRCDRDAQERSCFDVEVQKKLITPSLLEYVKFEKII